VKADHTASGLPVVDGGAGCIEWRTLDMMDRGDHRIAVADVVGVHQGRSKLMPLDALKWHYGG